jgi:hypothetical protein
MKKRRPVLLGCQDHPHSMQKEDDIGQNFRVHRGFIRQKHPTANGQCQNQPIVQNMLSAGQSFS